MKKKPVSIKLNPKDFYIIFMQGFIIGLIFSVVLMMFWSVML